MVLVQGGKLSGLNYSTINQKVGEYLAAAARRMEVAESAKAQANQVVSSGVRIWFYLPCVCRLKSAPSAWMP